MTPPTVAVAVPAPDLTGSWPIVGRATHLATVLEHLTGDRRRSVVIGGPAGVGKTRLLDEVLHTIDADALAVARVSANRSASAIPFGALAPLLPVDDLLADSVVGVLHRAAKAIANLGDGRDVVLAIDDAHLLDDASATLVHQLSLDGAVRLLLAIRTGEHLGPAVAGVVSATTTATVDLHELTRKELTALATTVLGGDVDGAALHALWEGSQGNVLYFRELLVSSIERGAIRLDGTTWRMHERPSVPPRLVELIERRLASIDDAGRAALELVAVGHSIGRSLLEDVVGTGVVSELVQRGLVVTGREARRQPVRVQHPLYEEALRARLSTRRLRQTQLQLADLVEGTGMRRRPDLLHVTTLRLDAGGRLDPALLEAAAMDAYFQLDIPLAERLTRAGVAAGAGPRLRRVLAELLRYQGRYEEAEAIVSGISMGDVDERERVMSAIVRAENLFRGLGEHDLAVRVVRDVLQTVKDPQWREELSANLAVMTALSGDVRTALAAATPIIDRGPSRAMTVASTAAVASLTFAGRADDATDIAERAFMVATSLGPQESQAVLAIHVMERCLGLVESGRLAEAESIARLSYEWALAGGHQLGQAWFAMLLGRSAQTGGRLEEAARRYRESALGFRDLRDHGIRRWALMGLAQTSAMLGRITDAASTIDEIDTAPRTAVQLLEAEVLRSRAWLAVARGAQSDARRLLLEAAEWASSRGQHGLELTMLHDLVRLGDTRMGAARTAEVAATVQGALAAARGLHAEGARQQNGELLDRAAEAFADIAANLYAAEAAAHASSAHRRAGRDSSAASSDARSRELAERCDHPVTPALGATAGAAARLTARELELATLAAKGMRGPEIAAQLGISVRTVNNLLQRAYTKLGISGRSELAARLLQS